MPEKIPVQIDQEKQRTTHSNKIHIQIQQRIPNSFYIAREKKKDAVDYGEKWEPCNMVWFFFPFATQSFMNRNSRLAHSCCHAHYQSPKAVCGQSRGQRVERVA